MDNELYGIYVGVAEFPLKTLASKGSKASGLNPQPTKIYWYVTYIWLVLNAEVSIPYDRITPETYLTALTVIFTPVYTILGFITPTVNR